MIGERENGRVKYCELYSVLYTSLDRQNGIRSFVSFYTCEVRPLRIVWKTALNNFATD